MSKRVYGTVKLSLTNVTGRVALPSFNSSGLVQDAADPAAPIYNRGQYLEVFVTNFATSPTVVGLRLGNSTVVATLPASAGAPVPSDVIPAVNSWVFYYAYNLADTHIAALTDTGTCDLFVSLVDGKDLA